MGWYSRTFDLKSDVENLLVYLNKPPRPGSLVRLLMKNGSSSNSTMADFLVVRVYGKKVKRFRGGNKYLVELKRL